MFGILDIHGQVAEVIDHLSGYTPTVSRHFRKNQVTDTGYAQGHEETLAAHFARPGSLDQAVPFHALVQQQLVVGQVETFVTHTDTDGSRSLSHTEL